MAINVEDVATDSELAEEIGGTERLAGLLPDDWANAQKARQHALDRVLTALSRRTPPVRDEDLQDVTELKRAVIYGAAERLFRMGMHADDDAMGIRRRTYERDFWAEVNALNPTLHDGGRGPAMTIGFFRR